MRSGSVYSGPVACYPGQSEAPSILLQLLAIGCAWLGPGDFPGQTKESGVDDSRPGGGDSGPGTDDSATDDSATPTDDSGTKPNEDCLVQEEATIWQTESLPTTYTDQALFRFSAHPQAASMDAVVAFGPAEGTDHSEWPILIRFNADNVIDARNGTIYTAEEVVEWGKGGTYEMRLEVDIPARTYSAFVIIDSDTRVIASDYAFRQEMADTDAIAAWGLLAVPYTGLEACNLMDDTIPPE